LRLVPLRRAPARLFPPPLWGEGGSFSVNGTSKYGEYDVAQENQELGITIQIAEGYELESISGGKAQVLQRPDGTWSVIVPRGGGVNLSAVLKRIIKEEMKNSAVSNPGASGSEEQTTVQKSSGYAQSAYDDMVQDFISYGAATGFDADVMTGFMSVDQVESDMQDAVAGLYAKTLTYYTRDNIAEAVYSAMEQATADRGITLEGETKTAVETVAEAVRMEYASYTAVPLVSQLRTLVQKLQKVMVIGLVVSAVLLCAAAFGAAMCAVLSFSGDRDAVAECGMSIENYNDIKEGDIIECFVMEEVKR